MQKLLAALMIAGGLSLASQVAANAVTITKPKGVVELFTSQGCYSCPPADKLIGKFSKTNEILGLSFHVDYWDYLGWKDSFASPKNTARQHNYARAQRERQVYTPQAVVNGRAHTVGSDERKIKAMIKQFEATGRGLNVPIHVTMGDDGLNIAIKEGDVEGSATLHMVFFNKAHTVKIDRGENGGKTLDYHNVVHSTQPLGLVKAEGFNMDYPVVEMAKAGFDSCALILQRNDPQGNPIEIVGAVVISDF